ncbi:putative GPI-anchored protein 58 isoform X1 [Arapaima gigas]
MQLKVVLGVSPCCNRGSPGLQHREAAGVPGPVMEEHKAPPPHLSFQLTSPREKTPCDTSPAGPPHPAHRYSDPAAPQHLSLASSQLLAELKSRAQQSPREVSPERSAMPLCLASVPTTPKASPESSADGAMSSVGGGLSLCSPELLWELKQSRSLRHVTPHTGLTTVFSGRGRTTRVSVHGLGPVSQSQVPVLPKALTSTKGEGGDNPVLTNGLQR